MSFAEKYGAWALVAGASEGVGSEFARALAERGLNVVLLARREAVLEDVASDIRKAAAVNTRVLPVDLARPQAMRSVAEATADLEVGLVVYCAGADPNFEPFLEQPIEAAFSMVQRNCTAPLEMSHHFARPMVKRGRGGIVLLGSGAGLAGAPNMVAYGASKAFDMIMAEALWAELRPAGVDVLGLILGETDTPALRRLRTHLGHRDDPNAPIPTATSPGRVVQEALENLPNGPTWFANDQLREGAPLLGSLPRREAVELMIHASAATMEAAARHRDS